MAGISPEPVPRDSLCLFALSGSRDLGARIAAELNIGLSPHEEREFQDGEHKSRPLVNVRGRDVYVIQSLFSDPQQSVNDKLCRLLFFIGALHDAAAASVTAVVPYLAYARKDQKTKPRDPVITRYIAGMFAAVGTGHVLTLDVHNLAAFQNAYRCLTEHLESCKLFADYFAKRLSGERVTILAPDAGAVKRAERFRRLLAVRMDAEPASAVMTKLRSGGVVSSSTVYGEIKDRVVIVYDDMISSGTTVINAVTACAGQAAGIHVAATHGAFTEQANALFSQNELNSVVVTDSVESAWIDGEGAKEKRVVLSVATLFAEAIGRMHNGGSIVELLEDPAPRG